MRVCPVLVDLRGALAIPENDPLIIAGPCAVENEQMFEDIAGMLHEENIRLIRASIFKPRTSPFSFQGVGIEGLEYMGKIAAKYDLRLVMEVMEGSQIQSVSPQASVLQVGTRNMHNYALLKQLGEQSLPVLLKRGFMADSKEFFLAAEYIRCGGNSRIMLCERGIRTFESSTRNTLDLNIIPVTHATTDLPIIVDPSHGTGRADAVTPMARAAMAAGADGLMIEVHPKPAKALSDGLQSLDFNRFKILVRQAREMYSAVRELSQ